MSIDIDAIGVIKWLSKRVYDKHAYAQTIIVSVLAWLILVGKCLLDGRDENFRDIVVLSIIVFTIAGILCLVVKQYRRIPRFRVDETGILFIIGTASYDERDVVQSKFVQKVARQFADEFYQRSAVELLDPYNTEIFLTYSEEKKKQFIIDSGAKLVIWGTLEKGKEKGNEAYYIRLDSGVAHGKISDDLSKMLSYNMVQVMQPIRNIRVLEDDNKIGFDWAADATELVAQYIMAEACYFSGYIERAIDAFCSLSACLKDNRRNLPYLAVLKNASKKRLIELYTVLSCVYYNKYRRTEDRNELDAMKCSLDKLYALDGAGIAFYEQMALYYFCSDRDIAKARKCIQECKKAKVKSVITMYDDAFLKLYDEYRPYVAYRCFAEYMTIFKKNKDLELITDIEGFISWVIQNEPEKIWLNWLLAILANEREDFLLSGRCLNAFNEWEFLETNQKLDECVHKLQKANEQKEPLV